MYLRDFEIFKNYCYLNVGKFSEFLDFYKSPDKIPYYTGKKSIIIDAASDPWDLTWVKDIAIRCKSSGIVSAILINDKLFADANQDLNFRFFPVWGYRYCQWIQQYSNRDFFHNSRATRVSCLNRIPRLHRAYTYYLLNQLPWCKDVFLSFYGLQAGNQLNANFVELTLGYIETELGSKVANFFANQIEKFPITHQAGYGWDNCHDAASNAYTDCYSNICTESSYDNFCPTEKTFKCIAAGTLIFPVACSNFVSLLTQLDLDINYTGMNLFEIDSIPDWKIRTQSVIDLLDQLYYNIEDIWRSNQDQLRSNQQVLQSKQLEYNILKNIQDHL
jgi:hypothetical protein